MAYSRVLVVYEQTSAGDRALLAADLIAERDGSQVTVVSVVQLEQVPRWRTRWSRGTGIWNDVLIECARTDLERAEQLLDCEARFEVLVGSERKAVAGAAQERGCDLIIVPAPRR